MKILLAEDQPQLNHVLKTALESVNNYQVDAVFNGQEAVNQVKQNAYDVIILDIMMPVMDGITALKQIRALGDRTYVMMLTAKSEVDDKVTGLDAGADDYLTKPFSLKELLARLRSRERRTDSYAQAKLSYEDIEVNNEEQELISHNSIHLANKEVDLLDFLIMNKGKNLTTQEILNHVWKNDPQADAQVVWLYICYLRQKLLSVQSKVKIKGKKGGAFTLTK